jgi:hypothetical protein
MNLNGSPSKPQIPANACYDLKNEPTKIVSKLKPLQEQSHELASHPQNVSQDRRRNHCSHIRGSRVTRAGGG